LIITCILTLKNLKSAPIINNYNKHTPYQKVFAIKDVDVDGTVCYAVL
jgi:hypothetical protein